VAPLNVSVNGTNVEATTETGEPDTTDVARSSVWYRWTAPFTVEVAIDTCTSDFDTALSVYTGSAVDSLTQTALDDNSCTSAEGNNNASKLIFNATANTIYYIRVDSYWASSGQGNFTLDLVLADNVAPDTSITDGPTRLTVDDTPTFSFGGSDNKSASANLLYSHKVVADGVIPDSVAWSVYSTNTSATLESLSDGPHIFYVKAVDEADASPAEQSFTVELRSPEVETTSPTGTNAPRLGDIIATFSEPMKPSTISTTTIKMKVGTKAVPVAVSLSGDGKTATINPYPTDPLKALAPNKKYKVTITTGAQDLHGKALDQNPALSGNQPKVWTFITGSS